MKTSKTFSWPVAAAIVCAIAELAYFAAQHNNAGPPSLLIVALGLSAVVLAGFGLATINQRGSRYKGKWPALLAMAAGLSCTAIFGYQFNRWNIAKSNLELHNLSQIASAAAEYARDFDGNYPHDLADLYLLGQVHGENLVSPFTFKDPHFMTEEPLKEMNVAKRRHFVLVHSDYLFTGTGLSLEILKQHPEILPQVIVATDKGVRKGLRGLAYADGHAAFVPADDLPAATIASNKARDAVQLPPSDFDKLMIEVSPDPGDDPTIHATTAP